MLSLDSLYGGIFRDPKMMAQSCWYEIEHLECTFSMLDVLLVSKKNSTTFWMGWWSYSWLELYHDMNTQSTQTDPNNLFNRSISLAASSSRSAIRSG